MRVISGIYKGRKLKGFDIEGTRPTMDRLKESLFAMIQTKLENSVCLDLFAGSGALGIEALSMGAKYVYFVDNNPKVISILKENLRGIDNNKIIRQDALSFLDDLQDKHITFDIIFLDPPYSFNLINPVLKKIEELNLLNDGGIIVCEYTTEQIISSYSTWKSRKYSDKNILIYKREER